MAKHTNAKKVTVNIWVTGDRVLLEVHDDGVGFDESKVFKSVGHGPANMQLVFTM